VRTTFLGAHALPPEYAGRSSDYIALVCQQMLPALAAEGLVDAVDVFCERIGFSLAETEAVFKAAQGLGLPVKLHAEQLSDMGGARLAAAYGALSCDHVEHLSAEGIAAMKASGTVAVLLPGAYYFLRDTHLPPIQALREAGVPMAVATDHNPGTSPALSLLLMAEHGEHTVQADRARGPRGRDPPCGPRAGAPSGAWRAGGRTPCQLRALGAARCRRARLLAGPAPGLPHRASGAHPCAIRSQSMSHAGSLFAAHALLPGGWARDVLLEWDEHGRLSAVRPASPAPAGVAVAAGPLLPGMPNLHSHAFQRAFAGLTEFRGPDAGAEHDSFWSWRKLMYRFAGVLAPDQLEAIATWLYVEMLEAGYTSVCEFHYVHHDRDGRPYADDATLSSCLLRAAARAGIGLTLLPVLYQTSGFGGRAPTDGQRRFIRSTDNMLRLLERLKPLCERNGARLGLAPHSLRAVPPDALTRGRAWSARPSTPRRPSTSTSPSRPARSMPAWPGAASARCNGC
jgi:cytosine/adenosine deaminase-related metal-dependent hydrolase